MDPGNGGSGILQIYNNLTKLWTPVCRQGFDDVDATVACRELGYAHGAHLPTEVFGYFTTAPRRSDVSCNGSESSILNCPYSDSTENCTLNDYVSISCFDTVSVGKFVFSIYYLIFVVNKKKKKSSDYATNINSSI